MKWIRQLCVFSAVFLVWILCFSVSMLPARAANDSAAIATYLKTTQEVDGKGKPYQVILPDWSQISFSQFPAINSRGSLNGKAYESQLGYDISRSWQPGTTPAQLLKLGDIAPALSGEMFSLNAIGEILGQSLGDVSLGDFELADWQSIKHLAQVVPGLSEMSAIAVPPIRDLLLSKGFDPNTLIGEITDLAGELKLGEIDLSQYPVSDIPGMSSVPMESFDKWGNSTLEGVPGLSSVPLGEFPNPVAEIGSVIQRIDMIYSSTETSRNKPISGSYQQGFNVPCDTECAYLEMDNLEDQGVVQRGEDEGLQWISGRYQEVQGGFGALGQANNGMEPTGRHPFGELFKVVVMEPSESQDAVDTALYFRFCNRFPVDMGCTPYFIGPVPWFTYRVNAPVFLGNLEGIQPSSEASVPTGATPPQSQAQSQANVNQSGSERSANSLLDMDCFGDLNFTNLGDALATLESAGSGDYEAVGIHTCADGGINCGRALGRYQFMSYNGYAKNLIEARPGGQEFLRKVNGGYQPTPTDLMQYFPPEDQDRALRQSLQSLADTASQQTDPTTGQPFQGDRLVERIAQMHFGGPASAIDGGSSDALGRLSLKQYGEQVSAQYRAQGGGQNQVCVPVSALNNDFTPVAPTDALTNDLPMTGWLHLPVKLLTVMVVASTLIWIDNTHKTP